MEDPKVKKYLALLLALVMVLSLTACAETGELSAFPSQTATVSSAV